jgi:hypothetical protein
MPKPPPPKHTRFPKGTSGNPGGRPKKHSLTAAIEAELDANPEMLKELAQRSLKEALKGDFRFWAALLERLDGKVNNSVEIDTKRTLQDVIQELDIDAIGKEDSPSGS